MWYFSYDKLDMYFSKLSFIVYFPMIYHICEWCVLPNHESVVAIVRLITVAVVEFLYYYYYYTFFWVLLLVNLVKNKLGRDDIGVIVKMLFL